MRTVRYVYGWFTAFLIVMTICDAVANGWMSQQQSDNWDGSLTMVFVMWTFLTGFVFTTALIREDA